MRRWRNRPNCAQNSEDTWEKIGFAVLTTVVMTFMMSCSALKGTCHFYLQCWRISQVRIQSHACSLPSVWRLIGWFFRAWGRSPAICPTVRVECHQARNFLTAHRNISYAVTALPRQFSQEPHGTTSQKMAFFIVIAVRTSNLATSRLYITVCGDA
jgi:hypothetical protein